MGKNIFLIDIPCFEPEYKLDTLYSYEGKGKSNLKEVLIKASNGYCMYCYTKILVDRKNFGVLEHSVEQFNSDKLKNCPSNISITCTKCNGSFKKKGERKRALTTEEKDDFETDEGILECGTTCTVACEKYCEVKQKYLEKEDAKIILQPSGVVNEITGNKFLIQYDVLKQRFIPSTNCTYTEDEKIFIEKHINRFNLNDSKYRTNEFSKFVQDVIEFEKVPQKSRYCNLIVDLFLEKIKILSLDDAVKMCGVIYSQMVIKSKN